MFDKCRQQCVTNPAIYASREATTPEEMSANMSQELTLADQACGRNCLRKYDKTYKLYASMELRIMQGYCKDEGIDEAELVKMVNANMEAQLQGDMQFAAQQQQEQAPPMQ